MKKNLPNRKSPRKKGYDYSSPGYYFITICTQYGIHRFGRIENGKMILNDAGKMVLSVWRGLPAQFPMITLDQFQIMPNHIHGIIKINNAVAPAVGTGLVPVPTDNPQNQRNTGNKTLGDIVGAFKSIISTRYIKGVNLGLVPPFHKRLLQLRCHDHIIRDKFELFRIRRYIRNNPANWQRDKMNPGAGNSVGETPVPYGEEIWMV